jgi:hypothetical protein
MAQMVSPAATRVASPQILLSVCSLLIFLHELPPEMPRSDLVRTLDSHLAAAALQEAQPLGSAVRYQDTASQKRQGSCLRREHARERCRQAGTATKKVSGLALVAPHTSKLAGGLGSCRNLYIASYAYML